MSRLDYRDLERRVNALIRAHLQGFREKYGYDPDENTLKPSRSGEDSSILISAFGGADLPEGMTDFFNSFAELALPDIWNGYFVGPPSWIVSIHRAAEPREVEDASGAHEVVVIGSDGGGGLFVSRMRHDSPIYQLPPGRIRDGRYLPQHGMTMENLRIADSFDEFIEHLVSGLEQAVETGGPNATGIRAKPRQGQAGRGYRE